MTRPESRISERKLRAIRLAISASGHDAEAIASHAPAALREPLLALELEAGDTLTDELDRAVAQLLPVTREDRHPTRSPAVRFAARRHAMTAAKHAAAADALPPPFRRLAASTPDELRAICTTLGLIISAVVAVHSRADRPLRVLGAQLAKRAIDLKPKWVELAESTELASAWTSDYPAQSTERRGAPLARALGRSFIAAQAAILDPRTADLLRRFARWDEHRSLRKHFDWNHCADDAFALAIAAAADSTHREDAQ